MTTKEINFALSRLAATEGVDAIFFQYPLPEELARLSCINREAQRAIRGSEVAQRKMLPRRLEHFSPDTTVGEFKRAFITLLNDPAFLRMSEEETKVVFDRFINGTLYKFHERKSKTIFIAYDLFIEALSDPRLAQPSPAAIGRFCHYLATKLNRFPAWIALRVFEKFSPFSHEAEPELKAHLKMRAEREFPVSWDSYQINGRRILFISLDEVDPRVWFGSNSSPHSLWGPDRSTPLHPLIHEAIWERVSSVRRDHPRALITLNMTGRAEAELPLNFTLPLVQQMTESRVFVKTRDTIRSDTVNPFYCRALDTLSDEELLELL